jgi:hypothetical protein
MKQIINMCIKTKGMDKYNAFESVKLRLRGKGSGYKEGPEK